MEMFPFNPLKSPFFLQANPQIDPLANSQHFPSIFPGFSMKTSICPGVGTPPFRVAGLAQAMALSALHPTALHRLGAGGILISGEKSDLISTKWVDFRIDSVFL